MDTSTSDNKFFSTTQIDSKNESINSDKFENKKKRKSDSESVPRQSKRRRCTRWTSEENERLRIAFEKYKGKHWKLIAAEVGNKNEDQCNQHWYRVLDPNIAKSKWAPSEDLLLMNTVDKHGSSAWKKISACLPGRTDLQCRHRWTRLIKKREQQMKAKEAQNRSDASYLNQNSTFTQNTNYSSEPSVKSTSKLRPTIISDKHFEGSTWNQQTNLQEECNSLDSNSTSSSPGKRLNISHTSTPFDESSISTSLSRNNLNSLGHLYNLDSSTIENNSNLSHLYNTSLVRMHPYPVSVQLDSFCSPTHSSSPLVHSFQVPGQSTHNVQSIQVSNLPRHFTQNAMNNFNQLPPIQSYEGKQLLSEVYFNRTQEMNDYIQKPINTPILQGSSTLSGSPSGRLLNHDFSDLIGKNGSNIWNNQQMKYSTDYFTNVSRNINPNQM